MLPECFLEPTLAICLCTCVLLSVADGVFAWSGWAIHLMRPLQYNQAQADCMQRVSGRTTTTTTITTGSGIRASDSDSDSESDSLTGGMLSTAGWEVLLSNLLEEAVPDLFVALTLALYDLGSR